MGNTVKTVLLLGLLSGLLLALGEWLGGAGGLLFAFVIAVAMNFGSYWFSDRIVLRMYRAEPVGPDHPLHGITARLAQRANLPMPKVYVIPDDSPNAFATGRNPKHAAVAATSGLLRFLDESEIEGVIAHELAHVKHRDILISSVAATVAATIMMVARMAQFAAIFGGFGGRDDGEGSNPLALLATIIVAPLAAMLIQAAISRSREFAADRGAAAIAGNPYGLVAALKKIDAAQQRIPLDANPATAHMFIMMPLSGRGILSLFSTHPPTEQRIRALLGTI
jgi:heat shock protein HtpX